MIGVVCNMDAPFVRRYIKMRELGYDVSGVAGAMVRLYNGKRKSRYVPAVIDVVDVKVIADNLVQVVYEEVRCERAATV